MIPMFMCYSLEIEEASAKTREGPPKDDEPDYALDVWAGIVPIRQIADAPRPDPRLDDGARLPTYLKGYRLG